MRNFAFGNNTCFECIIVLTLFIASFFPTCSKFVTMHSYSNYTLKAVVFCYNVIIVLGLEKFSVPNLKHNSDWQRGVCELFILSEPSPGFLGICGYKGKSCSVAVYKNHTEALIHKHINCNCYDQVFPAIFRSHETIAGKYFKTRLHVTSRSSVLRALNNFLNVMKNGDVYSMYKRRFNLQSKTYRPDGTI